MRDVNRPSVPVSGRSINPVDQPRSSGEESSVYVPELSPGSSPLGVVLVIDDDPRIVKTLQRLFATNGIEFWKSHSRTGGHEKISGPPHKGILIDLALFDFSGHEVCASHSQDPAMHVLAALVDVAKKDSLLEAPEIGYLTRPFDRQELLDQLRAATGRLSGPRRDVPVTFGDVHLDFASMRATKNGKPVVLTALQFRLIRFFLNNPDRVITRKEILSSVWEHDHCLTTRTVDNQVLKLRQRLEDDPANPVYFCTVYGVGYRFAPIVEQDAGSGCTTPSVFCVGSSKT